MLAITLFAYEGEYFRDFASAFNSLFSVMKGDLVIASFSLVTLQFPYMGQIFLITFIMFFYLTWNNLIIAKMQEVYFRTVPPLSDTTKQIRTVSSESLGNADAHPFSNQVLSKVSDSIRSNFTELLRQQVLRMSESFIERSYQYVFLPHSKELRIGDKCPYAPLCWVCNLASLYKTIMYELEENTKKLSE
jgi:hypothetical protein